MTTVPNLPEGIALFQAHRPEIVVPLGEKFEAVMRGDASVALASFVGWYYSTLDLAGREAFEQLIELSLHFVSHAEPEVKA